MVMRHLPVEWNRVLVACNVKPTTAAIWSEIFAAGIGEDTFSKDEQDLRNFLAQVLHESVMLEHLREDLSYSAGRLTKVWPRRFPTYSSALPYAGDPEALANKVYGGRLGNVEPGDGWKYIGRGLIMCTGKANYALLERLTKLPLVDYPVLLENPMYALICSVAWWEHSVDDDTLDDPERVREQVNGGHIGLEETLALTERVTNILKG